MDNCISSNPIDFGHRCLWIAIWTRISDLWLCCNNRFASEIGLTRYYSVMSSLLSATKTTKISDKNIFSYVQRGVDMVLFCFSQRSPTFEILCCCSLHTRWEAKQPWKGETLMNSIFCIFPSWIDFLYFSLVNGFLVQDTCLICMGCWGYWILRVCMG